MPLEHERDLASLRAWFAEEIRVLRADFANDSAAFRREIMAAQAEVARLRHIAVCMQAIERDPNSMVH